MRAGSLSKLQPLKKSSSRCLSTRATPNIDRRQLLSGLGLAGLAVAGSQTKAASASTVVPVSTSAATAMQGFKVCIWGVEVSQELGSFLDKEPQLHHMLTHNRRFSLRPRHLGWSVLCMRGQGKSSLLVLWVVSTRCSIG
jgi:hypothetical protein